MGQVLRAATLMRLLTVDQMHITHGDQWKLDDNAPHVQYRPIHFKAAHE